MQIQILFKLLICITVTSFCAFADHPNEGALELEHLLTEAENNSFELKSMEKSIQASEYLVKSQYSNFSPRLSLEAGPQSSQYNLEKSSGNFFYGKFEWNLYNGGIDSTEIERAKLLYNFELKKKESLRTKITFEVKKIYYELLFILESISLKERAIQINNEQTKIALAKKNAGLTSKSDVIEFELRDSTLNSDLILLRQQHHEKSRELSVLLDRQEDTRPIQVKGHLVRQQIYYDRAQVLNKVKEQNFDLIESSTDLKLALFDKKNSVAEFLPKINFEGQYGRLAGEGSLSSDNKDYQMLLKVSIPLFSGFQTWHVQRSLSAKIESKKINSDQRLLQVTAELDNTLNQIQVIQQRLDIEEKNLARSEEYYKITLSEYKRGLKNSPDMVGAAERLLDAHIRNLEYRRDLILAGLKIDLLTNVNTVVR